MVQKMRGMAETHGGCDYSFFAVRPRTGRPNAKGASELVCLRWHRPSQQRQGAEAKGDRPFQEVSEGQILAITGLAPADGPSAHRGDVGQPWRPCVRHADYEYGMRRAVNLVQDAFMDFLNSALYFDYMVESFNVNPDLE